MKKLILTSAALTFIALATQAQENSAPASQPAGAARQAPPQRPMPSPEGMAERRAKNMQAQLGLSDGQYKGIYDAELAFAKIMITAKGPRPSDPGAPGAPRPDPAQMRETIQNARAEKEAKYKAVLTPEQMAKYEAMSRPTPPPPPATPPASK